MIAEADADRRQVCEMVDRKIRDHAPDWWDEDQLSAEREYCGLIPGTPFTRWTDLKKLPGPRGALRRGGFIGFPARQHRRFDYPLGRIALLSCVLATPSVDAVVLIRDMDDQPIERAASLAEARAEIPPDRLKIALALPRTKREAWVLNGFDPQNRKETEALAALRQELGFDPRTRSEDLDAMAHGAKRDVKRVLAELTGNDRERETPCWMETAWPVLRERGEKSGLAGFLQEVKDRLVPLVTRQLPTQRR